MEWWTMSLGHYENLIISPTSQPHLLTFNHFLFFIVFFFSLLFLLLLLFQWCSLSSIKWRSVHPSFTPTQPNYSITAKSSTTPLLTSSSLFVCLLVFYFFFKWKKCKRNHFRMKYIFCSEWLKWYGI